MELEQQLKVAMKMIGDLVYSARKKLGLGKKKFGELCSGLSETYIREIENGDANVTIASLAKLKTGMQTIIPYLLTDNKRQFSEKTISKAKREDYNTVKNNVSIRLSKIVKHRGLNSGQFSSYLDMDESATNKYLNGEENPTYLMLLRFAYVLDVEVVDFFDYDGPLPNNDKYKARYIAP